MGLLGKIFAKEEKPETPAEEVDAKYANRVCAACSQPGADKSFAGQEWHRRCLRKMRKMAKSMI